MNERTPTHREQQLDLQLARTITLLQQMEALANGELPLGRRAER